MIVIIIIGIGSEITVVQTEGHGVCALQACNPPPHCYPLTIIRECGLYPNYYERMVFAMIVLGTIGFAMFAIMKNRAREFVKT
jgi:hypothetical protein